MTENNKLKYLEKIGKEESDLGEWSKVSTKYWQPLINVAKAAQDYSGLERRPNDLTYSGWRLGRRDALTRLNAALKRLEETK